MLQKLRKKAQSTTEMAFLIIVVLGALVALGTYIKRGIQGRWRDSVDSFGDQYDPKGMDTNIKHTLISNSTTVISTKEDAKGFWTERKDALSSVERTEGQSKADAY